MSTIGADYVRPSAGGTARALVRGTVAAWANLNGTGIIALRDSLNISSVVDAGTGSYRYQLASVMANDNGSATAGTFAFAMPSPTVTVQAITATQVAVTHRGTTAGSDTLADALIATVNIMGDLA